MNAGFPAPIVAPVGPVGAGLIVTLTTVEAALTQLVERFRQIIDNVPDTAVPFKPAVEIVYVFVPAMKPPRLANDEEGVTSAATTAGSVPQPVVIESTLPATPSQTTKFGNRPCEATGDGLPGSGSTFTDSVVTVRLLQFALFTQTKVYVVVVAIRVDNRNDAKVCAVPLLT